MSEVYLTMAEIEDLFQALTVAMIAATPDADVRIAWPAGGQPAHGISENVTYLRVAETDSPINRQREERLVEIMTGSPEASDPDYGTLEAAATKVVAVNWIAYGPLSNDYLNKIRDRLFWQEHHDALAREHVYMIPSIVAPRRAPEKFSGQWWERSDMTVYFNAAVRRELTVPYIKSAEMVVDNEAQQVTVIADTN